MKSTPFTRRMAGVLAIIFAAACFVYWLWPIHFGSYGDWSPQKFPEIPGPAPKIFRPITVNSTVIPNQSGLDDLIPQIRKTTEPTKLTREQRKEILDRLGEKIHFENSFAMTEPDHRDKTISLTSWGSTIWINATTYQWNSGKFLFDPIWNINSARESGTLWFTEQESGGTAALSVSAVFNNGPPFDLVLPDWPPFIKPPAPIQLVPFARFHGQCPADREGIYAWRTPSFTQWLSRIFSSPIPENLIIVEVKPHD